MTDKILIVGQTPPPLHGQAIMIDTLLKNRFNGVKLYHVRMHFSKTVSDIGKFQLMKLCQLLTTISKIYFYRIVFNIKVLYYPVSGPVKLATYRDIVVLLMTRWLFNRTIFHFHAAGISLLYPQLPSIARFFIRRAFSGAFAGIRLTELTPDDSKFLKAKHEYVIPYGIEDPFVNDDSKIKLSRCSDETLRILFVGVLQESKGVMDLIEACGQLLRQGVSFQTEFMGEFRSEEFRVCVQERIIELQINRCVKFLGVLSGKDKYEAFKRANCFCFPTFYESESFGVVLLEAMAFGLPIVTTNWRSIPTIIEDGKTGYLVEIHRPDLVAKYLAFLACNKIIRKQMGAAARMRFLEKYTSKIYLQQMNEMFIDALHN
jgi:glycosyltransferase involved in cell wall biosynthesis